MSRCVLPASTLRDPRGPRIRPHGRRARPAAGFTLIEVMIVVVVIGILAAIAYPSYQEHIRKGRRAAAQAYLMDLAQTQQRFLLDRRSYAGTEGDLGATTPTDVSPFYSITIAAPAVNPPAFTITATAIGSQAVDGDLTLNNLGAKTGKW
jgi:type IV pilus assembly protein PilE